MCQVFAVNTSAFVRISHFLWWSVSMFPLFTDPSTSVRTHCANRLCVTVEEEVSAEAGLCVVIPCSFSGFPFVKLPKISFFKCGSTQECDNPVMFPAHYSRFQALMDYEPLSKDCSIILNDLTESDSGSYFSLLRGKQNPPPIRMTLSVKGTESYSEICTTAEVSIPEKHNQGQNICILINLTKIKLVKTVIPCLLHCSGVSWRLPNSKYKSEYQLLTYSCYTCHWCSAVSRDLLTEFAGRKQRLSRTPHFTVVQPCAKNKKINPLISLEGFRVMN